MHRRGVRVTLLLLLLACTVAAAFVLVTLDGRLLSSIVSATQGIDDAAEAQLLTELGQVSRARWVTLGTIAMLLVLGLLALTPVARVPPRPEPVESLPVLPEAHAASAPQRAEPESSSRDVDLAALARLCTDLSRVTTPDALPALLGRSAAALHASGLILWLDIGDRLVPAIGHGYPAHVMSRLEPAQRTDDTAAAAAWRTGERKIVNSSDGSSGAVAVPLLGTAGCVGVLAFEVSQGQERDGEIQAAAALIAAQLATVVATPAPEASAELLPEPEERTAPASQAQSV